MDRWAVSEEVAEVDAGAAAAKATVTEATTIMEGEWEDHPAMQVIGQYQGRDIPEAIVRGPGVSPPQERQRRDRGPGRGQGQDRDRVVGGFGGNGESDPGVGAAAAAMTTTGKMAKTGTLGQWRGWRRWRKREEG